MAEQFYTILTSIGKAKIANSVTTGTKVNLTTLKVGDSNGSYYNPTELQTTLVNSVYSCGITSVEIDNDNANWLTIISAIPATVGGFSIREAGVFDADGDLIAIGKYPETYKPVASDGSTKELYLKMTLEVTNTSNVELKIDPTVIIATKNDIAILTNSVSLLNSQMLDMENKIDRPKSLLLYDNAVKNNIPINSLNVAKRAIALSTINVAFWGDSITEGKDQVYAGDSYANRVYNLIKKTFPNKTINFQNFGLAGKGITDANNSSFIGGTSDTSTTFYRSWSAVGKSWQQHIKDFAPDLLIVAFGMNDSQNGASCESEATNLQTLVNYINTWSKVPSVVLVPTILPTTNTALYSQRQDITNAVALATREFARNNGYTIADANRLFQILRDGQDEVIRNSTIEYGFSDVANNWSGDTSSFTIGSDVLIPNADVKGKYVIRNKIIDSGIIEIKVKLHAINLEGASFIKYRESDLGYFTVVLQDSYIQLYYSDSESSIISVPLSTPLETLTYIKIEYNGSKHTIYTGDYNNPTKQIEFTTYKGLHDGKVSIGGNVTIPDYQNIALTFFNKASGNPMYTEVELLGTTSPNDSGNGVNHPSGLGHAIYYLPSFYDIINELTRPITTSGVFIPTKVASGWSDPTGDYPTPNSGERMFYKILSGNYDKNNGIALRRTDTGAYYTLSTTAIDTTSLANLAPNTFAYYKFGASDIIFITVPSNGTVTWDCDLYRYQ